ncbi:MAG: hypothetical protein R3B38_01275 [Patescibacteria group bacterium]
MSSSFRIADPILDEFSAFSIELEVAISNGDTAVVCVTYHVLKNTGIQNAVAQSIRQVIAENSNRWDDFSQIRYDIAELTRTQLDKNVHELVMRKVGMPATPQDDKSRTEKEGLRNGRYPLHIHPDDILVHEKKAA